MPLTLYQMTEALELIRDADEDAEGADEMLDELLERLIPEKVAAYCGLLRSMELEIEAYGHEESRLAAHRTALERAGHRLRARLAANLERAGIEKLQAGTFRVSLQNSTPSVEVTHPLAVPPQFMVAAAPRVDKAALARALKSGEEFGFCRLVLGRHLRIR